MPSCKKRESTRDQESFDVWWSQRYFYTTDPLYNIYKEIHLKGADLNFIDCLTQYLRFADSLNTWRREEGGKRRGEGIPTRGELAKSIRVLSYLALDSVNFSRQQQRKENWPSWMKETLQGQLLIGYAANPEDFRLGGKSDRRGTLFLLVATEHFLQRGVKPRHNLAARLLKTLRGQRSAAGNKEAAKVKVRLDRFKKQTFDWEFRLREFVENLNYLAAI